MAVAAQPKRPAPDIELYKACKSRITDYYEYNAHAVRAKKTVTAAACIFDEMRRLVREVRRQGMAAELDDPDRFEKIERYVARVCQDHAASIAGGQFVKVSASVFSLYRFLVRANETVLKRLLAVEDLPGLGEYLPDEHRERIEVELEPGLEDGPVGDEPGRVTPPEDDDNLPG